MATTTDMAPTRSSSSRRASTAGTSARRSARKSREDQLGSQVQQLQNDLKSITETLTKLAEARVGEVKSIAKHEVKSAAATGMNAVEDVQDEFAHLEKQMKDTIRARPLTAVAGAIALGFVLAIVSR
jgi:ElaB/YqjD/DUF883 family membrane-anchored ribosome-binding protein